MAFLVLPFPYERACASLAHLRGRVLGSHGVQDLCSVTVRNIYSASIEKKKSESGLKISWHSCKNHESELEIMTSKAHTNTHTPFQMLYVAYKFWPPSFWVSCMCLVKILLFLHSLMTEKILQNSVMSENCKRFVERSIPFWKIDSCIGVSII